MSMLRYQMGGYYGIRVLLGIRWDGLVSRSHRDPRDGTQESNWVKDRVQGQVIIGVNG